MYLGAALRWGGNLCCIKRSTTAAEEDRPLHIRAIGQRKQAGKLKLGRRQTDAKIVQHTCVANLGCILENVMIVLSNPFNTTIRQNTLMNPHNF